MIQPSSLNNHWLASVRVSVEAFNSAEILFHNDDFQGSMDVLDSSIDQNWQAGKISGSKIVALYAWNLFYLKKTKELDDLFGSFESGLLSQYPDIQVVQVRRQIQTRNLSQALATCQKFIKENSSPVSPLVADFLFAKGMAEYKIGQSSQAAEDLEVSFSLFKLLKDSLGMGLAGNYLGFVNLRMSKYGEALRWLARTLEAFESQGLVRKQSMVLLNMGITHYKLGNLSESLKALSRSHEMGVQGNWPHRQLFTNIALGNVHRITRENQKARQHLHTAYTQAQKLQFPREEALALEFLGDVYRDESLFEEALRFYNRAMAIGRAIAPRGDIVMEVHRRLGECHLGQLDIKQAQEELGKALVLAKSQEDRYEEGIILRIIAEAWQYLGEVGEARRTINESIMILEDIGARYELAISLMQASEFALAEINQGRPSLPVSVMLTQAWDKATKAMDQLLNVDVPWWTERCQRLIKKISVMRDKQEFLHKASKSSNAAENAVTYQPSNVIIHKSRKMKDLLQLCDLFAQSEEPALLVGETGTGKELVARRLHELSDRSAGHLVSVNVSAIPETLFEREFFGHVKGAFSGADKDSLGYAGRAHGGTLFLDEIGDLPLEVQPKLLRLLQDGSYLALGDPAERHSDIRMVAATNADLAQKVQAGEFRSDLYYRLKILELELPPLRERQEDILLLLRHFLSEAANRPVDLADFFNRDSLDQMEHFEWPGNVREIAMVARRATMELQAKGRIDLQLTRPNGGRIDITGDPDLSLRGNLNNDQATSDAVERTRILMALEESGGSRSVAARQLVMSRSTLYRRMTKLGLKG